MQLSRRPPRRVALELTPLVDVVLMLVIFFMLTTTFVVGTGIKVDLPQGRAVQQPRESDAVITMTKEGRLYYQDERVSLEKLRAALQQTLQQQPGIRLVIKADTQVQHGQVVEVMDMAKRVGIEKLAIATAPKPSPEQR
jgi:biopolymer transport protein ExbD